MSQEMAYIVNRAVLWIPVHNDEVFARLIRMFPNETDAIYGVDQPSAFDVDEARGDIPREELLTAVERLVVAFKQIAELNPRQYVFDFEIIPGVSVKGHREVSGVRLHGKEKRYELIGGVDQCGLQEFDPSFLKPSSHKEYLDLREQTAIETESHGRINIRTTKKRSPIAGDLKRLSEFLQSQSGDTVTKRLS